MSNKKLKILFVSQYFYPENFKGNDIVFDLANRGHDVTVLTGKPNYPDGELYRGYGLFKKYSEVIQGVKVIRTPIYPRKNGRGINIILNYISFVVSSYFTCFLRLGSNFNLIFVQQLSPITVALPAIWMKKRCNVKMYMWVLDLWPESFVALSGIRNNIVINIIDKLVTYIYRNTDVFFVSSKSFANSINIRLKKQNVIHWLPNWADEIQYSNVDIKSLPSFPEGFNVVFAGNIGDAQGLNFVLESAKLTAEINWIFVGSGRYLESIKSKIKNENIKNAYVFGRFPIETMDYFYDKADAMLVSLASSPVFSLTVPAKIQSYMSKGKIILGMLDGEGNSLINDLEIGIAVKSEDYVALSKSAIKLKYLTKKERKIIENKSKLEYQNKFCKEKNLNNLEDILLGIKD